MLKPVAYTPTVYITASDQHRNGKTMLARLLADYLMLDGRDPFMIDTDAPEGPLRTYFPGRTALADFAHMQGQMKLFDTILGSPGRDYIIDLPARHLEGFFRAVNELNFFEETAKAGFRVILFFIVDRSAASLKAARAHQYIKGIDLFVPTINDHVGSYWPNRDSAFSIPALPPDISFAIADKRFSLRAFTLGDAQELTDENRQALSGFLFNVFSNLGNIEPLITLQNIKGA
jgi:hypothetical protein